MWLAVNLAHVTELSCAGIFAVIDIFVDGLARRAAAG